MARLPKVGGDTGNWGDVLNEYLLQSHDGNGVLRDGSVSSSTIAPGVLASVAKTGSYTDLTSKPAIPATATDVNAEPAGLSAATQSSLTASYVSYEQSHLFNFQAKNLRKWTKALARVRNGDADAKILCLGDSTTTGIKSSTYTTIAAIKSYPGRLSELMNTYMVPAAPGLGVPRSSSTSQPADNRWTAGTGWALNGSSLLFVGFGGKGSYYSGSGVTVGTLVYTDSRILADTFDIYYVASSSGGNFSVAATGGSTTNITTGGVSPANISKVTVSAASASTGNSVTISGLVAGKTIYIVAVEPYLSTARKVRIGNVGSSGSATLDWTSFNGGVTTNTYESIASIKAYAPDLTIIDLGINDAGNNVSVATYIANMQTLIAAAQVSGDVIIKTMLPSADSGRSTLEVQYIATLKTLGLPLIDFYGRVNPYTAYFASGMMDADGLHGTDYGYLDVAEFTLRALRSF